VAFLTLLTLAFQFAARAAAIRITHIRRHCHGLILGCLHFAARAVRPYCSRVKPISTVTCQCAIRPFSM
jgi:hypothetical protein